MLRASCTFATFGVLGKTLAVRAFLVAIAALPLFVTPARAGGLLLNGGFDTVGPTGSPVTTSGPGNDLSAAADWTQFALVPGSVLTTELLPTTDPWGSGNMIHVVTNNGYWTPDKAGNGFAQPFITLNSAVLSYDLYVVSGQVTGGLGLASTGAYVDYPTFGPTGGWIQVVDKSTQPVGAVAFTTLTQNAGADYYVDNAVLSAAPEPSSLVPAGIGMLAVLIYFNGRVGGRRGKNSPRGHGAGATKSNRKREEP